MKHGNQDTQGNKKPPCIARTGFTRGTTSLHTARGMLSNRCNGLSRPGLTIQPGVSRVTFHRSIAVRSSQPMAPACCRVGRCTPPDLRHLPTSIPSHGEKSTTLQASRFARTTRLVEPVRSSGFRLFYVQCLPVGFRTFEHQNPIQSGFHRFRRMCNMFTLPG